MSNYKYFSFPQTTENMTALNYLMQTEDTGRLLEDERIYQGFFKSESDIKSPNGKILVSINTDIQVFIMIETDKFNPEWENDFTNWSEYIDFDSAMSILTVQRLQN